MDYIIRDFQSIKEAKLKVKGFTLVLGESSSGKSACLRAMYAATHNRFRNGQVRHGEDHATIMVRNDGSSEIFTAIRPWSGSIKMKLGNEVFNKIGRTLPKQINDFLNFGTLDVAGDNYSLHFHDQFQKPLLLEYSQKKVMDVLSASKGIDDLMLVKDKLSEVRSENKGAFKVVDGMLASSNAQLSEVRKDIELREKLVNNMNDRYDNLKVVDSKGWELDRLKEAILKLSSIRRAEELLLKAIALQEVLEQTETKCNNLQELRVASSRIGNISKKGALLSNFISICPEQLQVTEMSQKIEDLKDSYKSSYNIDVRCERVNSRIKLLTRAANTRELMDGLPFSNVETLLFTLESFNVIKKRHDELKNIVDNGLCPVCHSKVE